MGWRQKRFEVAERRVQFLEGELIEARTQIVTGAESVERIRRLERLRTRLIDDNLELVWEVARLKDERLADELEEDRMDTRLLRQFTAEDEAMSLILEPRVAEARIRELETEVARLTDEAALLRVTLEFSQTVGSAAEACVDRYEAALERIVEVGGRNGYAARMAREALGPGFFDDKDQSTEAD